MKEAMYYEKKDGYIHCYLCPHHCMLKDGQIGRCGVRKVIEGKLYSINYGKISAINIDPIEKKPIVGWMPGSEILSIGSFGCNLHCQFCQNHDISMGKPYTIEMTPKEIIKKALDHGLPSIAYTYNEPTIFYEMMFDTAKLARKNALKSVIVTNGFIEEDPLLNILDYLDAMNIDLKTYSDHIYKRLGGSTVNRILRTIEIASAKCHVEISLLIVPGISDDIHKMEELFKRLAKINQDLILHISRYFPMYKYNELPTDINVMKRIQDNALKYFSRVNLGNVR
jgi:pyruvate formate lyase activating enzyme